MSLSLETFPIEQKKEKKRKKVTPQSGGGGTTPDHQVALWEMRHPAILGC